MAKFKPGESGNPNGRPKNPFSEMIRKETRGGQELIDKAVSIMRKSKDDDIVLKALAFLRDTGFGKPAQAVELSGRDGEALTVNLVTYANNSPV